MFRNCNLEEVDFTDAILTSSLFDNCNLKNSIFDQTNLEKVDFRTSFNIKLKPDINKIKGAKFSKANVIGLLDDYKITVE